MGKFLKILLTIFASLILIIIVAAIAIPLFVDPNEFKPQIIELVKKETGRDLSIDGDLEISVFPWIGVSTGELSISNAKGFADRPFAQIEQSDIKVKLLPLLSKKVEVSRIVLKGLDLYLAKNKRGVSNWADLVKTEKKPGKTPAKGQQTTPAEEKPSGPAVAALAVAGLSIENAHIVWDDQQSGQHTEIKNFNVDIDQIEFDRPVDVALSMEIVDAKAKSTVQLELDTQLTLNEALNRFKLNDLRLKTSLSGEKFKKPLKVLLTADSEIDLDKQTLALSNLQLRSGNLQLKADIKGTQIVSKPVFNGQLNIADFNLAGFLNDLGIKLDMRDSNALSHFSLHSQLQATAESASFANLAIKLDDSTLKGGVTIQNFKSQAIRFNLMLDHIDADRYLPPEKPKAKKSKKTVASPSAAAVAGASLFPVETLRKLNIQGKLVINSLIINKIPMRGTTLNIDSRKGVLKTSQSIKHLFQGSYHGQTVINVRGRTPSLSLNEKLSNVQIGPLLKALKDSDRMTGRVNASIRLKGYGKTSRAIKSTLNGAINFKISDSVIKGFNIQKMIDSVKTLLKGSPLPVENKNDQTLFTDISGTATIKNGILHNNDLVALSSRVNVTGKGIINLKNDSIDYKIRAAVTKRGQVDKVKGIPLVIKITRPLDKPSYTLDVAAMALEKNKEKIEKVKTKLLEKLDKKLGPGAGELLKSFF